MCLHIFSKYGEDTKYKVGGNEKYLRYMYRDQSSYQKQILVKKRFTRDRILLLTGLC